MADDLVLTPGGFRHPSLVHRLQEGQAVTRAGGVLRKFDLTMRAPIDLPPTEALKPALGSGWITNSSWLNNTGRPVSLFATTWRVPPAPQTQGEQTIFLFNALLDSAQDDILQPVLQWGVSQAGGGNFWAASCWFVDSSGHAFYRDLVQVKEGDKLVGVMTLTGQSNTSFNYVCSFEGLDGVGLTVQDISELVVATETLESYSIQNCTDYPNADRSLMTAIDIRTGDIPAQLGWTVTNRVTDCGQHTTIVSNASPGGEVDLFFRA